MKSVRFLLLTFLAEFAMAQSAGPFSTTGNMMVPRSGHTATLLNDGRVLITGGMDSTPADANPQSPLASAELYDPATGAFTVAGQMTTPRFLHTATLLGDGTMLIAGGYGPRGEQLHSAELYDPATGSFRAVGLMAEPHTRATLLADGRVLMTGYLSAHAELYDPASGTFTLSGAYGDPFSCESPDLLLADGRVLISEVQPPMLFDPASESFTPTGPMRYCYHDGAAVLPSGHVLFAGGDADADRSDVAEIYDPATGSFTATGKLAELLAWHDLTLLSDGTALVTGGELYDCAGNFCTFGGSTATAEVYDATAGTFATAGSMSARRELHTATVLLDGTVLIAGGETYRGIGLFDGSLNSAEIYHPAKVAPSTVLLSLSGDGKGQGAIQHASNYQLVSADNPAVAAEIIVVYCTGLLDGSVIPPQVSIGGRMAQVLWFGNVPGYPGLNQINLRVPGGIAAGPAVPVRMNYIGRPSNAVSIGVKQQQ
jgi:hypothetical protein